MKLAPDVEALLLRAIRRVPDSDTDAAWKYASDRLRPILWPTMDDVDEIAREVIRRYANKETANDAA
jgi:hypothetical protein